MGLTRANGFTLIETILVVAILVVLAGVVYAAAGPSREKARQATCMNNLRQFGIALAMYRSDYDGVDAGATPADWGLPPSPYELAPLLGNNPDVFHCPDIPPDTWADLSKHGSRFWTDYWWAVWGNPAEGGMGPWATAITLRGGEFPIMGCLEHDAPPEGRPQTARFAILLRLNGSTSAAWRPWTGAVTQSWQW